MKNGKDLSRQDLQQEKWLRSVARCGSLYETCQRLADMGYTINRPPRDGHMAFVRSPDKISIEILQEGNLEPKEPWASMENTGTW